MAINLKRPSWPGWVWLQHAAENAAGAAFIAAGTVIGLFETAKLSLGQWDLHITDVPWYALLTFATLGALGSFLKSLGTLFAGPGENNGTASLNPRVIARAGSDSEPKS